MKKKNFSEDPVWVSDQAQVVKLKENYCQKQKITYSCIDCKKSHTIRLTNFVDLRCKSCGIKYKKCSKKTNEPFFIESLQSLTTLKGIGFPFSQKISFNCEKCKKFSTIQIGYFLKRPKLFCENCKRLQTFLEKPKGWGIERFEKTKKTYQKKYGSVEAGIRIQQKHNLETLRKRYDVDAPMHLDSVVQKIKKSWKEKSVEELKNINLKRQKTYEVKTGFKNPMQNPSVRKNFKRRYYFENECFDSSWELALWIYAKDHNELIEREPCSFEYEFEGRKHFYYPDFRYKGELIEIKGDHLLRGSPYGEKSKNQQMVRYECALRNQVNIWTFEEVKFCLSYIYNNYGKNYLNGFRKM